MKNDEFLRCFDFFRNIDPRDDDTYHDNMILVASEHIHIDNGILRFPVHDGFSADFVHRLINEGRIE